MNVEINNRQNVNAWYKIVIIPKKKKQIRFFFFFKFEYLLASGTKLHLHCWEQKGDKCCDLAQQNVNAITPLSLSLNQH